MQFPYTKSLWKDALSIFGEEINRTISFPFRNVDVLFGEMTLQFGLYKNNTVPIQFHENVARFVMITSENNFIELDKIMKQNPKMFCINCDHTYYVKQSQKFLSLYFPNRPSFELTL